MEPMAVEEWCPLDLQAPFAFKFGSYGLMILNCRIELEAGVLTKLWEGAAVRATVDGGTDRWLRFLDDTGIIVANRCPDLVSGDFDSIDSKTLTYCSAQKGCQVVRTPDQDFTDFEKALRLLTDKTPNHLDSVVVVSECTGRIDQTLSNLNSLRLGPDLVGQPDVYLLTAESLTWHLASGQHSIRIPQYLRDRLQWCAILPFEPKENSVSTTGLKWNLDGQTLKLGGLISSSNTYDGAELVTIRTHAQLLWSMGL